MSAFSIAGVAASAQAISAANAERIGTVSAKTSDALLKAQNLQADVERLFMISQALWDILKEHHGYTDEDLLARVQAIDLQDGKLDGKAPKPPPAVCPSCNRLALRRQSVPQCLYCGASITLSPFQR
jgi:hypothetical protein